MATDDKAKHETILKKVLAAASGMPPRETPPSMGARIHRISRDVSGNADPYAEIKRRSNELALGLLGDLQREVRRSADPFETAVRYAIAGNIIDFGPTASCSESDIHEAIGDCRRAPIDRGALETFRRAAGAARRILYIGDNAGEIVFDRLLVERLRGDAVTFAVRGSPVINDATTADAEQSGLTDLVRVIDSGSDVPGIIPEACSPDFRETFHDADLVVAKGQGNYETLSETDRPIVFLFKAKCPVIARDAGCGIGDNVVSIR